VAHTAGQLDLVALELHPGAAAVTGAAAGQLVGNEVAGHRHPAGIPSMTATSA